MQHPQKSSMSSSSIANDSALPENDARAAAISLERRAMLEAKFLRKAPASTSVSAEQSTGPKPLSFAQESLWFLDQFAPNTSLYNIPHVLRVTGDLQIVSLQKSLQW